MCEKCEELKAAAADTQQVIGKVSPLLLADYNNHLLARHNADLDLDQLVLDTKRAYLNEQIDEDEADKRQEQIDRTLEANEEKYDAEHKALWLRVYDELGINGLNKHLGYTFDRTTGEIRRKDTPWGDVLGDVLGELIAGASEVHVSKQ